MNVKKLVTLLTIGALAVSFTGCNNAPKNVADESKKVNNKISVVGSTSVQPLAQAMADEYLKDKPNLKIDIQGVGSSVGIKSIADKTADIGTSSRELKPEEKTGLVEHIVAIDGIAVIVNPKNTVKTLTKAQITDIFSGKISNWKQVGGNDKKIILVSREASSGTRGAFEELLKLTQTKDGKTISLVEAASPLIVDSNGAVKANIATKEDAIGYLSLGIVDDKVKALDVDSVKATVENVKNKSYPIQRPLLMLTRASDITPQAKAFIDYALGEKGQKIVENKGFISNK